VPGSRNGDRHKSRIPAQFVDHEDAAMESRLSLAIMVSRLDSNPDPY